MFDFVGNVRDHLNGAAQIISTALLAQYCVVHATRRKVIGTAHYRARESLVVTQIEIRFRTVVGDEDLSMLEGTHRAGVDVDVRVQLEEGDFETARFKHSSEGGGSDPLTQGRHNTTSNEHISRHGFHQCERAPGRLSRRLSGISLRWTISLTGRPARLNSK